MLIDLHYLATLKTPQSGYLLSRPSSELGTFPESSNSLGQLSRSNDDAARVSSFSFYPYCKGPLPSWLRHCATSRRVAGSISDGVSGVFLLT
jgi:hypothetical protein